MNECKVKILPCDLSASKLSEFDSNLLDDFKLYREIVGSLIYLMTCTRPDLSFVVNKLAQHMSSPCRAHLELAKHALRYLKGTLDYDLKFNKSHCPIQLTGFCDSDWGSSEDRPSISGYCFKLTSFGPLISWKTQKQRTVALSCEAEYMAITAAIQEAKFLRQLLSDMLGSELSVVSLFADDQGAISHAKNPVNHQRSKHIDIRFHFIRSEVSQGNIILNYVQSDENV